MNNTIRLTESELKKLVSEIIQEAFTSNALSVMIQEHGGLNPRMKKYDARTASVNIDLNTAEPIAYIPAETSEILNEMNWSVPLGEQLLYCNDGGLIAIKRGANADVSDYKKKLNKKNVEQGYSRADSGPETNKYATIARRIIARKK